jgi:hypothetical protein
MPAVNPRIAALVTAGAVAAANMLPDLSDDPKLSEYQQQCTSAMAHFISEVPKLGPYRITFGEAWRPAWVAVTYAKRGMGISNSLHTQRLAFDLNLIKNGKYTDNPEDYKPLAEAWIVIGRTFHVEPAAGYYFRSRDAVHFSCAWNGVM